MRLIDADALLEKSNMLLAIMTISAPMENEMRMITNGLMD